MRTRKNNDQPETCPILPSEPLAFDIHLSEKSAGFERIYIKKGVMTFFGHNNIFGYRGIDNFRAEECIEGVRYGHRHDKRHDNWHESARDFEHIHTHLLKPKQELVTPEELTCILDSLAKLQRGFKNQIKTGNITRLEGDEECIRLDYDHQLLTQKDRLDLLKQYEDFYYQQHPDKKPQQQSTPQNQQNVYIEFYKTVTHAFITTLMNNYIKPYLIFEKGHDPIKLGFIVPILEAALTTLLTLSPLKAGLELAAKTILKEALLKTGLDLTAAENFSGRIASVIAITQNPFMIGNLLIGYGASEMGQQLAYKLIRILPKMRPEPEARHVEEAVHPQPSDIQARKSR